MKKTGARAASIMLAAGMVFTSAAGVLPGIQSSIVAFAGENDFQWSSYSKKDQSWWQGSEAAALADEMIAYQLSDGGWRKDMKNATTGSWNKSTIDNNATWGQIRFLANVYNATGIQKYKTSCLKGLDLLLNGQYSNGGWPQVFNDAGTYHAHITYNDSAMVQVLNIMLEVSQKKGAFAWVDSNYQSKANNAVDKGIKCILNTQIKINGTLTAWGQQHDENTLAPAGARAYELPSVCTSESAGVVDFLRALPESKQSADVIRSINAAVRWFDAVKIENKKFDWNSDKTDKVLTTSNGSTIWARFYDLQNSKPLFSDRDGKAYTDVSQISLERRTGYSWYGNWCANNIKLGTLPEPSTPSQTQTQGTHIYVGYSNKSNNYNTIQAAVDAAAAKNPSSEQTRVNIHIAPGTYREQVRVNTPYISFINDEPTKEVKITWYYGIGYKYYSMGSDGYYNASNANSKSSKGEATRWGSAVALHTNASNFRAEYITFENSFNRYVTDEEIRDGVEPSGSEAITYQRTKGADVKSKTATERAAAIAIEGDNSEFYKCTFLGSQDTLFTRGAHEYFRECRIEGNTDYIFGQGTCIFQNCDLVWAGYTDKAVGGYITAAKSDGKYLFADCNIFGASGMKIGAGNFGRPWGADADVAFVNTKLSSESMINSAGWASMSGNAPENARFKEYNTTVNGSPVNTSGRVSGTVKSSANGLDVNTYLNGWVPYYYTNSGTPSQPITVDPINGTLIKALTPQANDYSSLWAIDDSLAVGDRLYTDRDNMTYTQIPDTLIGAETIVTPCDAKKISGDLATFTANGNITVYIALDNRVTSIPSWLSGYTRTYQTVTSSTDVVYDIYSKEFKSGENVTLGTNGQSSSCTGYTVFVKKNIPAPINGSRVLGLAANENALPDLWNIDTDIQVGDLIYTDRDGVTYTELPSQLVGAEAIVTPCDAKKIDSDLASFTAGRDITVYVIYDSRITASTPAWLTSYTRTDMTVKNVQDVIYNVYSRDFRAGEKVTLGTNGQSSSCTGYSVIVTDIYKEAPVLMGDVNMDGKFTISDVVEVNKWLNNAGQLVNSKAADVNKDGSIDRNDLDMMMNAIVGKTKF
ncbi:pectate lyase [uncultured Ruminococcus sp.]|uniref:pectate lyase n=1 Tax=uncultured Ruminococcus sp. TaxID=165186 RepID=UPI0025EDDDB6|nr:pectate lyase [uncultured Ruminococcus sp.]